MAIVYIGFQIVNKFLLILRIETGARGINVNRNQDFGHESAGLQ
jgi:hypothetical protein